MAPRAKLVLARGLRLAVFGVSASTERALLRRPQEAPTCTAEVDSGRVRTRADRHRLASASALQPGACTILHIRSRSRARTLVGHASTVRISEVHGSISPLRRTEEDPAGQLTPAGKGYMGVWRVAQPGRLPHLHLRRKIDPSVHGADVRDGFWKSSVYRAGYSSLIPAGGTSVESQSGGSS